jgi:hypothetical protein
MNLGNLVRSIERWFKYIYVLEKHKFDVFFKYVVITYLNYFGKGAKWNN